MSKPKGPVIHGKYSTYSIKGCRCVLCTSAGATYRKNYRQTHRKILAAAAKRASIKSRLLLDNIKDKPCTDCGNSFPPECMDFDHLEDKKFNIGQMYKLRAAVLLQEIAKCEVVCANCHRTRTRKRQNQIRS